MTCESGLQPKERKTRVFGLDILRAVAILSVIYAHGYQVVHGTADAKLYSVFLFDGVTLFFVLSGYLIGDILIRLFDRPKVTTGELFNFWARRWLRTLPNYFFVLILLIVVQRWNTGALPEGAAQFFLFVQNFAWRHPGFFPEAWSLSVEEWFYVLVPLLAFGLARGCRLSGRMTFLILIIAIMVFSVAMRCVRFAEMLRLGADVVNWDESVRKQVVTRLDSPMFGVLGAYLKNYHTRFWFSWGRKAVIPGVVLLGFTLRHDYFPVPIASPVFLLTFSSMGCLFLLPYFSTVRGRPGLVHGFFTGTSRISYSLYLSNYFLVQSVLMPPLVGWWMLAGPDVFHASLRFGLYLALTTGVSLLLYRGIEIPFLQLRDRLFPGGTVHVAPEEFGAAGRISPGLTPDALPITKAGE